jgi:Ca2+-binding RTX toxin-like protein
MGDTVIASSSDILSIDQAAGNAIGADAISGSITSDEFVYFAAFDGTGNTRDNNPKANSHSTNVVALFEQIQSSFGGNIQGNYFFGPGTPQAVAGSAWAPGRVSLQVSNQAEIAYEDFAARAIAWLKIPGNQGKKVTLALTSFSRGDASAAIFSQLVYEKGLVDHGVVLIPPGQIGVSAGVIFDPVTTGVSGNLAFSPNATNIVDIRAANEYRSLFRSTDYTKDAISVSNIVNVLGNHSDIGGGYDYGIGSITLNAATQFFRNSGLTINDPVNGIVGPIQIHKEIGVDLSVAGVAVKNVYTWGQDYSPQDYTSLPAMADTSSAPPRQYSTDDVILAPTVIGGKSVLQLNNGDKLTIAQLGNSSERVEIDHSVVPSSVDVIATTEIDDIKTYIKTNGAAYATTVADEVKSDLSVSEADILATVNVNNDTLAINVGNYGLAKLEVDAGSNVDLSTSTIQIKGTNSSSKNVSTLSGASAQASKYVWLASDSTKYQYDKDAGSMTVSGGVLGSNKIIIKNFDLNTAQNKINGYLGIKLGTQISLNIGADPSNPLSKDPNVQPPSVLAAGETTVFTISLSEASKTAQTVSLSLSGATGGNFAVDAGNGLQSLASGSINVTIPAGQTFVTLGLVNTLQTTATQAIQLSATLQPSGTGTIPPASNTLSFTTLAGNTLQSGYGQSTTPVHVTAAETDYYGDGGNNAIVATAAHNRVDGAGGNDSIVGSGNDTIVTGGGNSVISGSAQSTDEILVGNGKNIIFANSHAVVDQSGAVDINAAIAAEYAKTATGAKGVLIGTGNGNNTIVGGAGDDVIWVGEGNNTIVLGPGSTHLWCGERVTSESDTWSLTVNGNSWYPNGFTPTDGGYTASSNYEGNEDFDGNPTGLGNNVIYATSGTFDIALSNGNNYFYTGSANGSAYGGMGSDTIVCGAGNVNIGGGGGDSLLIAGSGLDTLFGDAGNNTVVGGSGVDELYAGEKNLTGTSSGNNYVYGGSGDSKLFGSDGHDTLIGGTGNATIQGGDGYEYIVGGSGNVSINGGNGSDTIYAGGNGKDTIFAGTGHNTIYGGGVGGFDYIEGTSGSDVIYAGDGGTAEAATTVHAGSGSTTIVGGLGVDYLRGGSGACDISAGDGGTAERATVVEGGSGDTTIRGGLGFDYLAGGSGNTVIYAGDGGSSSSRNTIVAGSGKTTIHGGAGTDAIWGGSNINVLYAGAGGSADVPTAVHAGSGQTTLVGGSGTSVLYGGSGADFFQVDSGNVSIVAGTGQSSLSVGANFGNVQVSSQTPDAAFGILDIDSAVDLTQMNATAEITADGQAALNINSRTSTIQFIGGLTNAITGVQIGAAPTTSVGQLFTTLGMASQSVTGANGNLIFVVDANSTITGGAGQDTLISWGGHTTLTAGTGYDNTLYSNGVGSDVLRGNGLSDTLTGSATGDTLIGGSNVSGSDTLIANAADTLVAGAGQTTFIINNSAAFISPPPHGANYKIQSSVNYTLTNGLNNLTLTGNDNLKATGGNTAAIITGNAGNDTLVAGNASDTLVAGTGIDTLIGNSGYANNTFIINNSSDVIQASASGNSTVQSSVNYVLPSGNLELILTGSAALTATGGASYDSIYGNTGADTLIGGTVGTQLHAVSGAAQTTFVAGTGNNDMYGNAGDIYQFNSGFGNSTIESANAGTIVFGAGIQASDLIVTAVSGTGTDSPSLQIQSGTSILTIQNGFASSAASTFKFADGTSLNLDQLLAKVHAVGATVSMGSTGNAQYQFFDGNNQTITASDGATNLHAWGLGDTLVGSGTSNQLLSAEDGNAVLIGGRGFDTLHAAAAGNDTLIAGQGDTLMQGGSGNNVYELLAGSSSEIDESAGTGAEELLLPSGMSLSQFQPSVIGNDLLIESVDGQTSVVIKNYFDPSLANKTWWINGDQVTPQFIKSWLATAGATQQNARTYAQVTADLTNHTPGLLRAELNSLGNAGTGIGSFGVILYGDLWTENINYNFSGFDNYYLGNYTYSGITTSDSAVINGHLVLASSENSSEVYRETTYNETISVPVYGTRVVPASTETITLPDGLVGFSTPYGWTYSVVTNSMTITIPAYTETYRTGTTTQTLTYTSGAYDVSNGFVIQNVVGDGGNDVIVTNNPFVGTLHTGDGNVIVNLTGGNDFSRPSLLDSIMLNQIPFPAIVPGALIIAGSGSDSIVGTKGGDTICAGSGFDYMNGGGGADNYYVPLSPGSVSVVDDPAIAGYEAVGDGGFSYHPFEGKPSPQSTDTLVLPDGVTPEQIQYSILQSALNNTTLMLNYDGLGGKASVAVVYDQGLDNQNGSGIEDFKFSGGLDLTLQQLLSRATPYSGTAAVLPTVQAHDVSINLHQTVALSDLFSTTLPTGGEPVLYYQIYDSNWPHGINLVGGDGSEDAINAIRMTNTFYSDDYEDEEGTVAYVSPAQLSSFKYSGEWSGTDQLAVVAITSHGATAPVKFNIATKSLVAYEENQVIDAHSDFDNGDNETLVGGYANDTLIGGDHGAYVFQVSEGSEVVQAQAGATNTIVSSVDFDAPENVQNLVFTGSDDVVGSAVGGNVVITGNSGNDTLYAFSGHTTLVGGSGNNTFYLYNASDVVQAAAGGLNTVQTYASFTAGNNVQTLKSVGSASVALTGGANTTLIKGNNGNDTLTAGAAAATLIGGAGSNTFVINNTADVVQAGSGGVNTVRTSANYTAGTNVQIVTGTGTANLSLSGSSANNVITGNSGNDTLTAGSGNETLIAGSGSTATTLIGGTGNDTFVVNNSDDVVQVSSTTTTNTIVSSVDFDAPENVQNLVFTGSDDVVGSAGGGNVVITGNSGNDTLYAFSDHTTLVGGSGNNTFYLYNASDVVQAAAGGLNTVQTYASFTAGNNVQTLKSVGSASVALTGGANTTLIKGNNGNDTLTAGAAAATLIGGAGSNTFVINNTADVVQAGSGGFNMVKSSVSYVQPANVTELMLTGSGSMTGTASSANALLIAANTGAATLTGGTGVDVLEAVNTAADTLTDTSGMAALIGGSGADKLTSGSAADFIAGGSGNDTIVTGASSNVLAFNRGDGLDVVQATSGASDVVALGMGISDADLSFTKSANDLVMHTGTTDAITFSNWFAGSANHDVVTLQVMESMSSDYNPSSSNVLVNSAIETFSFTQLVAAYQAALTANPSLTSWSLMNGMLSAHLSSSNTAAFGGDLAYDYGTRGNLTGMDLSAAQAALQTTGFGSSAQTVHSWASVSQTTAKLS